MKRFMCIVMAMLCMLVLSLTLPVPTALAASQSTGPHTVRTAATYYDCGNTCENQDPYTTGCGSLSNGAYMANYESIVDQSGTELAAVSNWYSPECGTNWNVTYLYSGIAVKASIYRSNTMPVYCYPTDCQSFYTGTVSPIWTNMAYAPTVAAYATTTVQSPNDHLYYTANISA